MRSRVRARAPARRLDATPDPILLDSPIAPQRRGHSRKQSSITKLARPRWPRSGHNALSRCSAMQALTYREPEDQPMSKAKQVALYLRYGSARTARPRLPASRARQGRRPSRLGDRPDLRGRWRLRSQGSEPAPSIEPDAQGCGERPFPGSHGLVHRPDGQERPARRQRDGGTGCCRVALYSDPQAIDSTIPFGKAMMQMACVFGELERNMIRARVMAGLNHVRQQGLKKLGWPPIARRIEEVIRRQLGTGHAILKVAGMVGCGSGRVQRANRAMVPAPTVRDCRGDCSSGQWG